MKEMRYNDKMWFGRHKGERISDLIKHDPAYVQKIIKEGKIRLDPKTNNYYEERFGSKKSSIGLGGYGGGYGSTSTGRPIYGLDNDVEQLEVPRARTIVDVLDEPGQERYVPEPRHEQRLVNTHLRVNYAGPDMLMNEFTNTLSKVFEQERMPQQTLEAISDLFMKKITARTHLIYNGIYDFIFIRNHNEGDIINCLSLAIRDSITGRIINKYDLR